MDYYNIQKILVPIDLSESSLNALQMAMNIAKEKSAFIQLLYIEEDGQDFYPKAEGSSHIYGSENILKALVNSFQQSHGIKPILVLEKGNAADLIAAITYTEKFDLIVLGMHGISGYRNGYIGTTAYHVLKSASCPVLLIPSNRKWMQFRKALFPVRLSQDALSRYSIITHFLAPNSKLEIAGLVNKGEDKTRLLQQMVDDRQQKLMEDNVEANVSWLTGNEITESILRAAVESSADLLVLSSSLDVVTKPFFIGPHVQRIVNCARIPVLCVKRPGTTSFA